MPIKPFHTPLRKLEPEWFDYNGHLNMAYYNVLFDNAVDVLFDHLGCGEAYRKQENKSFFTAESHVVYVRELRPGSRVRVDIRVLDCDDKRLHVFEHLYHEEGWLSATAESLLLHVDMEGPKVAPMPAALREKMEALKEIHAGLPADERIGRSIGIRRRALQP